MSARGFRSVGWVAGVAATALGCYMVNLQVASTRAALDDVETEIVIAQRDIRVLQTEIGTRGRLAQLERWNVKVLALSAPQANQFLEGGFALAAMVAPKKTLDPAAPIVLASAPTSAPSPLLGQAVGDSKSVPGTDAGGLLHVASLPRDLPATSAKTAPIAPKAAPAAAPKVSSAGKLVETKPAAKTKLADKKAVDKLAPLGSARADISAKDAKPKGSPKKTAAAAAPGAAKPREAKPKQ